MKSKMNGRMRGVLTAICIAILSVALIPSAFANPKGGGYSHGQEMMEEGSRMGRGHVDKMERMAEFLDLTESQQAQIEQIMEGEREANSELRETHRASKEKIRALIDADSFDEAAVRAVAEESAQQQIELMISKARTHHAIHQILTPEQRVLAEKMKSMKRGGKGRHGGGSGMRGDRS